MLEVAPFVVLDMDSQGSLELFQMDEAFQMCIRFFVALGVHNPDILSLVGLPY